MITVITVTVTTPDGTTGVTEAIDYALDNPMNYPDSADIAEWGVNVSTGTEATEGAAAEAAELEAELGESPVYTAHFTPEAWQDDQAIEVAPGGPQTWDCTAYASQRMPYLARLAAEYGAPDGLLDNDDVFKDDPAAPQWIRDWRGPFTIRITERSASATLTAAELRVLRGTVESRSRNYQPQESDLEAASTLIARGLIEQNPGFTACLIPTSGGYGAYADHADDPQAR
jgi:hypothetical protein